MIILAIKILFCICGALLSILALYQRWWDTFPISSILLAGFGWRWILLGAWFFFFRGHVSGDVSGYVLHVNWVLHGLVPNRDFSTPYGFYLNYIFAIPYFLIKNPVSIVFFVQTLEFTGIYILYRNLRNVLGISRSKLFVLLYVSNPLIISWFAFDGQEEALLAAGFSLIVSALLSSLPILRWMAPAILLLGVKITSVFMIAPYVLLRSTRDWIGITASLVLLATPAILAGSQVISFRFSRESGGYDDLANNIFPGNPWYIITSVLDPPDIFTASRIAMAVALAASLLLLCAKRNTKNVLMFLAAGTLLLSMTYQMTSSYTSPGFLAVAVPALLIIIISYYDLTIKSLVPYMLIVWTLLASLDVPIYFRFADVLRLNALTTLKIAFIVYECLIVTSNAMVATWIIRLIWLSDLRNSSDGRPDLSHDGTPLLAQQEPQKRLIQRGDGELLP